MQTRTFGFTAIAALISLGIGFTLSRRLISPLQNLASTTSQIAEGNLAVRANVRASVGRLQQGSPVLERLIEKDGLLVVGAEYSLVGGDVEFFDL